MVIRVSLRAIDTTRGASVQLLVATPQGYKTQQGPTLELTAAECLQLVRWLCAATNRGFAANAAVQQTDIATFEDPVLMRYAFNALNQTLNSAESGEIARFPVLAKIAEWRSRLLPGESLAAFKLRLSGDGSKAEYWLQFSVANPDLFN